MSDDKAWQNWRKALRVHPVADEFPQASDKALKELRGSIGPDGSGMEMDIVLGSIAGAEPVLIDGRTRLDALEANGVRVFDSHGHLAVKHRVEQLAEEADAWVLGRRLNLDRRHLKHEDKVAIAKSILANCPSRSNRSIAAETGLCPTSLAKIREEMAPPAAEPPAAGVHDGHLDAPPTEPPVADVPATAPETTEPPAAPAAPPKPAKRTGADGKSYPVKPPKPKTVACDLPKAEPSNDIPPGKVARIEELEGECARLRHVNLALTDEVEDLKTENAKLRAENERLMEQITAPAPMGADKVMEGRVTLLA